MSSAIVPTLQEIASDLDIPKQKVAEISAFLTSIEYKTADLMSQPARIEEFLISKGIGFETYARLVNHPDFIENLIHRAMAFSIIPRIPLYLDRLAQVALNNPEKSDLFFKILKSQWKQLDQSESHQTINVMAVKEMTMNQLNREAEQLIKKIPVQDYKDILKASGNEDNQGPIP